MTLALLPFAIVCGAVLILGAAQALHRRKASLHQLFPELNGDPRG